MSCLAFSTHFALEVFPCRSPESSMFSVTAAWETDVRMDWVCFHQSPGKDPGDSRLLLLQALLGKPTVTLFHTHRQSYRRDSQRGKSGAKRQSLSNFGTCCQIAPHRLLSDWTLPSAVNESACSLPGLSNVVNVWDSAGECW